VAFGQHLRPHQNINFIGMHGIENIVKRFFAAGAISIYALNSGCWKELF
jgi:hypothetical protein